MPFTLESMLVTLRPGPCRRCGMHQLPPHKCPPPYHPAVARMMAELTMQAPTWRPSPREAARIRLGLQP